MAPPRRQYTPEEVTAGLVALVAHGGHVIAAKEELAEIEIQIPLATLRSWRDDIHKDRYQQLDLERGRELEDITVRRLRSNAERAAEIEAELLDKLRPDNIEPELLPQALKAVADSKSKSVDKLLALTGRPTDGRDPRPDLAQLLRSLGNKGLVKLNVELDVGGDEPETVEGTAEDTPALEAGDED